MSLPLLPLPGPAPTLLLALALALALALLYLLHPLLALLVHDARSPLRLLPGPRAPSFLLGNLAAIADQENTDVIAQWVAHHGSTFVYRGFVGGRRLLTTDPAALAWILGRAYEFPKPEFVRESLAAMAAGQDGLLTVEGDVHRRQRKILNQAFTAPHVRTLVPIFWSKASQLRDIFLHIADDPASAHPHLSPGLSQDAPPPPPPSSSPLAIPSSPPPSLSSPSSPISPPPTSPHAAKVRTRSSVDSFAILRSLDPVRHALAPLNGPTNGCAEKNKEARGLRHRRGADRAAEKDGEKPKRETAETRPTVDVLSWLGRATLDVIGEAGFGYRFASLASATKRLVAAADNRANTTTTAGSDADGGSDGDSELAAAFGVIFSTARRFRVMTVLQVWFPLLRRFRRNNETMRDAHATMRRIGLQLIQERRAFVEAELAALAPPATPTSAASAVPAVWGVEPRVSGGEKRNGTSEGEANGYAGADDGTGRKTADRIEGDRTMLGRDILSVLIRSNMASTPAQQLSLSEVLSQISTFLAAGHETTASALTWTLYALARAPDEQRRLRSALRALGPSSAPPPSTTRGARAAPLLDPGLASASDPDLDPDPALLAAIERLPALDRAVKEALRLHAPVGSTMRTYAGAARETVVPVARGVRVRVPRGVGAALASVLVGVPALLARRVRERARRVLRWVRRWRGLGGGGEDGEERDGDGEERERGGAEEEWTIERGVRLHRGDIITIPIQAVNRSKEVWGEDAKEFRPDRWIELPKAASELQGLYAHTLTFLDGHRACIGYKFALSEIKVFLYVLLRDIEFSIDEDVVIEKRVNVVTRPFVKSAPGSGNQMPLRIRRVREDED